MILRQVPGKITAIGEVASTKVQSAPARLQGRGRTEPLTWTRTDQLGPTFHSKGFWGDVMKARFIGPTRLLMFILLSLSFAACAPKYMINGRVLDAETRHPIKGAAIAIRWYESHSDTDSTTTRTINVNQALSDDQGNFTFPDYPDKNYVMGVYKEGYICWSSRSSFSNGTKAAAVSKDDTQTRNGMQVCLEPFKEEHSQDQHASFTVLVAEEVTASKKSPFYEAIKPVFMRWRDSLREEFKKTFGRQKSTEPE